MPILVNDVSGGLADPRMLDVVAGRGAPYVVMHWRAHSDHCAMREHDAYDDVVAEVLRRAVAAASRHAVAAGIAEDRLVVDPGLGFAKTAEHNWELLAGLDAELDSLGFPCWSGPAASPSSAPCWPVPTAARARWTTARTPTWRSTTLAAIQGVWGMRVHDVRASLDAIRCGQPVARRADRPVPVLPDRR